jgi:ribonuclease J
VAGRRESELVFLPLGGIGEIGMNAYLYGLGRPRERQWLLVDLGITFAGEREPGIDVVLPDMSFLEGERANLVGLLLTHCHEDHFGAVGELWPRLRCDIYATPFTAQLLRVKSAENGLPYDLPIKELAPKAKVEIGPFGVELVTMAHSIPEANGVVIRTDAGMVFHTGDWKIDDNQPHGPPTDSARLKQIGDEGVAAMICDSTNATRDGYSPSEGDVTETLTRIIGNAKHRVAVTTFASNVQRLRIVMEATRAAGRHLVVVGRAMLRIILVARETGHLPTDWELLGEDDYGHLPRDKVVALCTGSQGEPRGALARIAGGEHPNVSLARDDLVIFSSRTIPGNEKAVAKVQNDLADLGVDIITDADDLVHVSGHPRRGELEEMYSWVRPAVAIPMHGEPRHLSEHAKLARRLGVETVVSPRNGDVVRLLPGPAEIIDEAPAGRLYRDGRLIVPADGHSVGERRKLSYVGHVGVSIVVNAKGDLIAEPQASLIGLPEFDENGLPLHDAVMSAVMGAVDGMPRPRRKDNALLAETVRRAVRGEVGASWGKKPVCNVLVSRL